MGGCAFHFAEIFHLVEIRSMFCLYLHSGLEFFNQILQRWSKFEWEHFDIPLLKIWNICACAIMRLLVYTYYIQVSRHGTSWKLTLRIPLDKWGLLVTSWMRSLDFSKKHFLLCNFLPEMSTFTSAIKLTFGRNGFSKKTICNLQTRIHFSKKSRNQVDEIIYHFIYQNVSPM